MGIRERNRIFAMSIRELRCSTYLIENERTRIFTSKEERKTL